MSAFILFVIGCIALCLVRTGRATGRRGVDVETPSDHPSITYIGNVSDYQR